MKRKIKVYITSLEKLKWNGRVIEEKLKELHKNSNNEYELTNDHELADIILITEVYTENREEKLINNELYVAYPNKCFSITFVDRPIILAHGIYSSCEKSILRVNRIRTGSYALYPDEDKNLFIKKFLSSTKSPSKEYLFSFIGRNSNPIRGLLFKQRFSRQDVYIEDSSCFDLYANPPDKHERQKHYVDILTKSKFSLCPRGWGTSSIRLFESMELGISPIIISDDWIPPMEPKWNLFSVRIKEKHITEIDKIIISYESSFAEMGNIARIEYNKYFSDENYFNYVIKNCLDIQDNQIIHENLYHNINRYYLFIRKLKKRLISVIKS